MTYKYEGLLWRLWRLKAGYFAGPSRETSSLSSPMGRRCCTFSGEGLNLIKGVGIARTYAREDYAAKCMTLFEALGVIIWSVAMRSNDDSSYTTSSKYAWAHSKACDLVSCSKGPIANTHMHWVAIIANGIETLCFLNTLKTATHQH